MDIFLRLISFLQNMADSWVFGFLAGILGILGFFVSFFGAYKAYKAAAAAKDTQDTVRSSLLSYRHHVSMTEMINTLKGARSSIVTDKIQIDRSLLISIRSASKRLLAVNQELFQQRTRVAVQALYRCADDIVNELDSSGEVPTGCDLTLIDALDEAIVILEEEDFTREHQNAE